MQKITFIFEVPSGPTCYDPDTGQACAYAPQYLTCQLFKENNAFGPGTVEYMYKCFACLAACKAARDAEEESE
jgi:hypothetical protein